MDVKAVATPNPVTLSGAPAATGGGRVANDTPAAVPGSTLALSQQSAILNELSQGGLEWGSKFKTVPPVPRTASELQEWFNAYKEAVQQRISEILVDLNVSLDTPVTLQQGSDGSVTVSGDQPQARQVETAAQHPVIQSLLQSVGNRQQLTGVLAQGGELRKADGPEARARAEANLATRVQRPAPVQLTLHPAPSTPATP